MLLDARQREVSSDVCNQSCSKTDKMSVHIRGIIFLKQLALGFVKAEN